MQAIILAGGLGTRLRPFSLTIPKPLLPLGDRPIIDLILGQLRATGFDRVCVSLGYMAPLFQAFLGDGQRWGLKLDYVVEDQPLGTAGALRLVRELDPDFLVLNGDTLTDVDFGSVLRAHREANAWGTIFCAKVEDLVDYGVVDIDARGLLANYHEKPRNTYYVSTGVYALSRRVLQLAPEPKQRFDMPDLFRAAVAAGHPVLCHRSDGAYWRDIGRFDHYEAASRDYQDNPERFLSSPRAAG